MTTEEKLAEIEKEVDILSDVKHKAIRKDFDTIIWFNR